MTNKVSRVPSRSRSIRFQLVLAVNSVLLLFAAAFLVYDYQRELSDRFDEKKNALQEEAKALLPGVMHLKSHGLETVQAYVDEVCGRMEDVDSPSHHIAVEIGGELIQAHAHHRQSSKLVEAMKLALASQDQRLRTEENDLIVGMLSQDNITVFVSEDVAQIRSQVFSDVMRRMWGLIAMGLVAAMIVNLVLVRMVSRPLQILVEKVREVGRGDYTTKLKTFRSAELNFLSIEINAMSDALANSEQARQVRLEKARKIQENLLPGDVNITGVGVGRIYCPAEEVGGDYFDILPHGKNGLLVCMADVTDHGVPAAMTAAMLKTLLLQAKDQSKSPADILKNMNRIFMDVSLYGDFASIILIHLDLDNGQLVYANAGHDPAWLIESGGNVIELAATGTLLGILEEEQWGEQTLTIFDRSRLAISTDGITETFNVNGSQFGKLRLLDELLGHDSLSAPKTSELIHESVKQFRGDEKQHDDVTLLLLDLHPKRSEKLEHSAVQKSDSNDGHFKNVLPKEDSTKLAE